MTKYTIREFQRRFAAGEFASKDISVQIEAGWYDWFCSEGALAGKTKRMGLIIKHIHDGGKVDLDNALLAFKNNCPVVGNLYDSFQIVDKDTRETLYWVGCDCWRDGGRYVVLSKSDNFGKPVFVTDSSRELERWFNSK